MKVPTVHLNGTSKAALLEQAYSAAEALTRALDALAEASPNGRDYYPQGDGALAQALTEHRQRVEAVRRVRDEMVALYEAVYDIGGGH